MRINELKNVQCDVFQESNLVTYTFHGGTLAVQDSLIINIKNGFYRIIIGNNFV